jgi:hypothetical protein
MGGKGEPEFEKRRFDIGEQTYNKQRETGCARKD